MKHKRKKFIICLFLATLFSTLLIGCNDSTSSEEKATTTINGVDVVYTRAVAKPVDKNNTKYELATSFKDEDFYYYVYYLGRIENVPLQSANEVTVQEYIGIPFSYTFETTKTTTTSIETQIAEANEECSNWQDELSREMSVTAGVTIGPKDVAQTSLETTFSAGFQHAWGGEITTSIENTITEAQEYSEESSKKIEISFDENFKHGFYRYILMGDIDVFATIIYDVEEDVYYCENTNSIVSRRYRLDYSDNSEFLSATNQNLPFDYPDLSKLAQPTLDCTPEITSEDPVLSYNSASKSLIVNLSSYQETGIVTLEDTSENKWFEDHFKDNVLTIPPKYNSQEIKKVKIVGSYLKEDEDGYAINASISNFSIRLDEGIDHDLKVVLQNVAFSSPDNASALDFAGISNHKVMLMFKGNNKIESNGAQAALQANSLEMEAMEDGAKIDILGASNQNGGNGGNAITCTDLTILSGDVTIKGGDGKHGANDQNGGNGGNALTCTNLTVVSGNITIQGGNGGNGGNGSYNGDGTDGNAGKSGGFGGIAVIAESTSFSSGNIKIFGGVGGNGGNGGDGDNGGLFGPKDRKGGHGGNGGNGGSALQVSSITVDENLSIAVKGGAGGNGGNGGRGGGESVTYGGPGGNGGHGGKGGNIFNENIATPPTQTEEYEVGKGGNGGVHGYSPANYTMSNGNNGADGVFNP